MWRDLLISAHLYVATASAIVVPRSHVVHEERSQTAGRWVKRDRVTTDATLSVRIGLAQSNLEQGHDFLMDVSDPSSPNYGRHWTSEEVIDMFRPSDETIETVSQWLQDGGIFNESITQSDNKGWLAFPATAKQIERLLYTEYHEYEDLKTGGVQAACDRYHVPAYIGQHIDYITPGIKLMAPSDIVTEETSRDLQKRYGPESDVQPLRPRRRHWRPHWPHWQPRPSSKDDLRHCDVEITPACIAALYEISPNVGEVHESNSLGIYEAGLNYWDQLDLDLFFTNFTRIPNGTHPIDENIDGGVARTTNISAAGVEGTLDLESAYPIVYPQTITVFNVDDLVYQSNPYVSLASGNTFLDAIDGSYCTYSAYGETGDAPGFDPTYPDPAPGGYKGRLQCGVYKPTNVISISYSGYEVDVPIAYQKRQCNEYLKLGLQGVSFLIASGDSGIGNYPSPYGYDGPTGCLGPNNNIFNPGFPINCPYATAVGATKVYPGHTVFEPESAAYDPALSDMQTNFSSGGGFSNVYPIPSYQKNAVASYFAHHDPGLPYYSSIATDALLPVLPNVTALAGNTGGIYNRIGRGFPDVAANGDNIATYTGGSFGLQGGTSASTPIFAAIVTRINEERLRVGKRPVGFLNPALYANPWVLNDITNGTNKACLGQGFEAVQGWDPVTGLGTPSFPRMLELFLSLP
ncbi:hypothetical protein M409DRAFT_37264 [Zasmidium cellare ATCC 36951]|uniref:Peptidase S53 domain-containing protein n=1 Tax=Zasmidium cellare ATCC 36951 TaxID=1080233 RepID=A0A6A6C8S1_ZASCE|nr:uncharacterized protein M409DRAFT_37264 [Zasmidium cellare ATCC 36951]KAF2163435.1 hypothetical protein M409DRAFT_37264 [Zasmidium cellare ATCC 36951]